MTADRLWRRTRRPAGPRLDDALRRELVDLEAGAVHLDAPLGPWTSFGAGGPAEAVVEVGDGEGLGRLVRWCQRRRIPLTVLGRGCGTVVRSGGLWGVVAVTTALDGLRRTDDGGRGAGGRLLAGAGVRPAELVRLATAEGLGGVHELSGVDGTVGGLLRRHWPRIRPLVASVAVVGPSGRIRSRDAADAGRGGALDLPGRSAVAWAVFDLPPAGTAPVEPDPTPTPSGRSGGDRPGGRVRLFADPEGQRASEVLAGLDLHGIRLREVVIDPDDANVAVNRGRGTAADLRRLADYLKKTASASCGVDLVERFEIVGNGPPRAVGLD